MSRVRAVLALFLLACASAAGANADTQIADPVVRDFVATLVNDDVEAVRRLAANADASLGSMIAIIDRYDCIEVRSAVVELLRDDPRERVLRITIDATGVTSGGIERVEGLPAIWNLEAVATPRGWRLSSVTTEEQRLAAAMLAAASDDERRALLDPHVDLGRLSTQLAWLAAEPEQGERGFAAIRFAADLAAATGDARSVEFARQMEATLDVMLRRDEESVRVAKASVERSLAVGDPDTIANAYFTLGIAQWTSDDLVAASDAFRASAALVDSLADPRKAIRSMVNLASLEGGRRRMSAALSAADDVARASHRYHWPQGEVDALLSQAPLYENLGNHALAEQVSRKAYALALRLGRPVQIGMASYNLGESALRRGDSDEALRIFRELATDPRFDVELPARLMIATTLEIQGHAAEAATVYEEIANGPPIYAARAKIRLSHLALRDSPARALALAREGSELLTKIGMGSSRNLVDPWDPKTAEGAALRALGRNAEAEAAFQTAIAEIDAERGSFAFVESTNADFFQDRLEPYRQALELMLLDGRNADALRLSDRLKGVVLDEIRNAARTDLASLITAEEGKAQEQIENEIAQLNFELLDAKHDGKSSAALKASLADARARWEQLETALYVRHGVHRAPNLADPLASPEALLPDATQAILDFVVGEKKTTLFVLSRRDGEAMTIETHSIAVGAATLQRDVDRFLHRLAGGSFDYADEARRLYEVLIAPARATLRGKKVVAIVADGPLWQLPFQALQNRAGASLLEELALFYAPSLATLSRDARREHTAAASVLAIGNPSASGEAVATAEPRAGARLGDLPDAAAEARQVASLYDRKRSVLLTGREATESAMKKQAPAYDVLHIAAHAVTNDAQPLYSSIVLARGATDDGLLEGREITRLPLRARLAVLSACSTAQGHVRAGEGLIGLSWAFLVAGCPTIVAAQWRVPSASTAKLMVDFHRELARGDRTVAEALRQAQLRMMKDPRYRHPLYWSGFVVIGAGRS